MSIPASTIVSVNPGILSAGGNPLAFNGLLLSENAKVPFGDPVPFPSAVSVSDYFGASSVEAAMAAVYFNGFDNSTTKPNKLLIDRYAKTAIAAFMRGAQSTAALADLAAITTGSLYIVTDGTTATITTVTLAGSTSFDDVASKLTAAFAGTTKPTITYDSDFEAFVATSNSTGSLSTITYATGSLAATLNFTLAAGATLSQGSAAQTPKQTLDAVVAATQNWVGFANTVEPDLATKKLFGAWTAATAGRYFYSCWDTDVTNYATPGVGNLSFANYLKQNDIGGTIVTYGAKDKAAFVLGCFASIDFTETNGRTTLAFRSQSGLLPDVTDQTKAANITENGANYYGTFGTANDSFIWYQDGRISGDYKWSDPYVDAIWFNNEIQLSLMNMFKLQKSFPYNQQGYAIVRAAIQDPINAALNFGAIQKGIALSDAQIAAVNADAGIQIASIISTQGYYLQVKDASAQTRSLRQSPPIKLWYTDGGSIQKINVNSIDIQ